MCITEETLNHFLAGATLEATQPIKMYGDNRIQIWLENGSFLSIHIEGDILHFDLLGPGPPENEELRIVWEGEGFGPPPDF